MKSSLIYRLLFGFLLCFSLYALAYAKPLDEKKEKTAVIGFYNVENLFDIYDDPRKADDEFTPDSAKEWNKYRYQRKLDRLGEVIGNMGNGTYPALLGLCEVENIGVLEDLASNERIEKANYQPVLIEGPDGRGIDVGLLYSKNEFKLVSAESYAIDLGPDERPTRDILHVRGKIKGGPKLHVLVNHWPSRYGGAEESEHKRMAAAKVLAEKTASIKRDYPDEFVICMGDFNDYPDNKSITDVLPTKGDDAYLVNLMSGLKETKRGSYNYKGDWDFLDQIIVSCNLTDGQLPDIVSGSTAPFYTDSMVYVHPKYGDIKPHRTYGGPNYYGGYSDHLPVYTVLAY